MIPVLRSSTAPLPGRPAEANTHQAISHASTEVGDLVRITTWNTTADVPGSVLTIRAGYNQLVNYFHDDGTNDGSLGIAWKIAEQAGAQVYQAFDTSSPMTDCRTALRVYQKDTFDTSAFPFAAPVSFPDGNIAPDPGNIAGLDSSRDYLIEAIAGWWLVNDTINCTPGAPAGFSDLIETAGPGWSDLAMANQGVSGLSSIDPGTFTDNVTSSNCRGSVACAVAILGKLSARRAIISHAVLTAPEANLRRAIVSHAVFTAPEPINARRAIISHAVLRAPDYAFPGQISYMFHPSWARYRYQVGTPTFPSARRAIISHAVFTAPVRERRAIISHAELKAPVPLPLSGPLYGSWFPTPNTFYRDQHDAWLGNSTRLKTIANFGAGVMSASTWSSCWNRSGSVPVWDSWGIIPWLEADQSRRIVIHLPLAGHSPTQGRQPLERVAQGLDNVAAGMDAFADAVYARPEYRDAIIRLGWEFDGNWFNWGILNPGSGGVPATNSPATFVAAFNYVANRMRARQPSAQWTFNVCYSAGFTHSQAYYESTFPSTADNIGIDIYDKANVGEYGYQVTDSDIASGAATAKWANLWNNKHLPQLNAASQFARSKGKPTSLPEWGLQYALTTPIGAGQAGGNDNPNFIQNIYNWMFDANNVCEYHQYFNTHPDPTHYQWRLISATPPSVSKPFPNAEAKYKQLFG